MCEVDFFIGLTALLLNTDLGNLKDALSVTANVESLLAEAVNSVIPWEIGCTSQEGTELCIPKA